MGATREALTCTWLVTVVTSARKYYCIGPSGFIVLPLLQSTWYIIVHYPTYFPNIFALDLKRLIKKLEVDDILPQPSVTKSVVLVWEIELLQELTGHDSVGNVDRALEELIRKTQTELPSVPRFDLALFPVLFSADNLCRFTFPDPGRHSMGDNNARARKALTQRNRVVRPKLEELHEDIGNILNMITTQNSCSGHGPVLDLPNSILMMTFCEANKLSNRTFSPPHGTMPNARRPGVRGYQTSLSISHTCGPFRDVALRCREMWQDIDLRYMPVKLAKIFANRAGGSLAVTLSIKLSKANERFVLNRIHIITHITISEPVNNGRWPYPPTIYATSATSHNRLQRFGNIIAPELKSLNILYRSPKEIDNLFHATPHLEALVLKDIFIPWSVDMYHGLTKLDLEFWSHIHSNTDVSFMEIFRSFPLLNSVRLVFPKGGLVRVSTKGLVKDLYAMNKLQQLKLTLHYNEMCYILRLLATPPDMKISLDGYRPILFSGPDRYLAVASWNTFFPPDPRCLPCLDYMHTVAFNQDGIFAWRENEVETPSVKIVSEPGSPKTCERRRVRGWEIDLQILKEIFNSRTSHLIRVLRLYKFPAEELVSLLWGLKNLQTLSFDILVGPSTAIASARKYPIPFCPNLTTIGFHNVNAEPESLLELLNTFPKLEKLEAFTCCVLIQTSQEVPVRTMWRLRGLGHTGPIVVRFQVDGQQVDRKYEYSIVKKCWKKLR